MDKIRNMLKFGKFLKIHQIESNFQLRTNKPKTVKWSKSCHYSYQYALGRWLE